MIIQTLVDAAQPTFPYISSQFRCDCNKDCLSGADEANCSKCILPQSENKNSFIRVLMILVYYKQSLSHILSDLDNDNFKMIAGEKKMNTYLLCN